VAKTDEGIHVDRLHGHAGVVGHVVARDGTATVDELVERAETVEHARPPRVQAEAAPGIAVLAQPLDDLGRAPLAAEQPRKREAAIPPPTIRTRTQTPRSRRPSPR